MAEENSSPISAPVPPAVNPLGSQVSQHAATLKLKPVIRKPVIGGLRPQPVLPANPRPTHLRRAVGLKNPLARGTRKSPPHRVSPNAPPAPKFKFF